MLMQDNVQVASQLLPLIGRIGWIISHQLSIRKVKCLSNAIVESQLLP